MEDHMPGGILAALWRRMSGKGGTMEIREIDDGVAVAGQLAVEDVARLAGMGFRTLIDNRPDNEAGAVPHEQMQAAAEAAGMKFHYIPVVPGQPVDAAAAAMAAALAESDRPVLAYCRSGNRSTNLYWQAIQKAQ
jgi:uncharacterized protein (TIGR01244 family)